MWAHRQSSSERPGCAVASSQRFTHLGSVFGRDALVAILGCLAKLDVRLETAARSCAFCCRLVIKQGEVDYGQ